MNMILVDMLIRKILTKEINPITGEVFKTADIKNAAYKTEVENRFNAQ